MPLAGTPPREDLDDRQEHNLEIEQDAPLGDVLEVATHHAVEVGVVSVSHLPPAGDAGLHGQALQVELGVLLDLAG